MTTLLLRLAAPIQSWGVGSKFDRRGTQREPTKSGVIGLLAAALGRRRHEDVTDLTQGLRFGVRADREGALLRDYQTVEAKKPYVTHRYYLEDAMFLVGLEGERALLETLHAALLAPAFPLYLGRRSCPPEGRLVLGILPLSLENALQSTPCLHSGGWRYPPRIVVDARYDEPGAWIQRDQPVSFDRLHRRFSDRPMRALRPIHMQQPAPGGQEPETTHDPLAALTPPTQPQEDW